MFQRIPNKTKRIYCAYERLMVNQAAKPGLSASVLGLTLLCCSFQDPSRNHRAYRLSVAKLGPPYIPFMPLLLKGNSSSFRAASGRRLAHVLSVVSPKT